MRERFEQQMEILHTELIELGALCEQAIGRTYEVLLEGNQRAAEEIIKKDQVVDAKEREIEDLCFRIILQQQPVARDLRQVSAALKMITDMERIGDQASDIAELARFIRKGSSQHSHLNQMATDVVKMISESVDAFIHLDIDRARQVIAYDDVVDDLFNDMKKEMMQAIREQNLDADRVVDYLMMAKYLEKVGDHAVNIAQWAIFRMTGDMEGVKLY